MIKYGVSGKKFTADKWCQKCVEYHKKYIDDGRIPNERKSRRGRGSAKSTK